MNQEWWLGIEHSVAEFSNHKDYEVFESEDEAKDWLHGLNNPYISPAREIYGPYTLREMLRKALNK